MTLNLIADGILLAKNDGEAPLLLDGQSALDLMGEIWGLDDGTIRKLIILKEDVSEDFFDLKTGIAGEILQKFVNYRFQIAIAGNFDGYSSKSLKDFIYECNKGDAIRFTDSVDSAVAALSR